MIEYTNTNEKFRSKYNLFFKNKLCYCKKIFLSRDARHKDYQTRFIRIECITTEIPDIPRRYRCISGKDDSKKEQLFIEKRNLEVFRTLGH